MQGGAQHELIARIVARVLPPRTRCGGNMRLNAFITERMHVMTILEQVSVEAQASPLRHSGTPAPAAAPHGASALNPRPGVYPDAKIPAITEAARWRRWHGPVAVTKPTSRR